MTICVGFVCLDGLVLAADRQMTSPNNYTFPECKLHALKWKNGRAIWGYAADNADTVKAFWSELEKRFALDVTIQRADIAATLREALIASPLKKGEGFHILFAAWTETEEKILLRSSGRDVVEGGPCEVIGYGDSALTRYLRGIFTKSPRPTIFQAAMMAIYLVLQAKTYDGQFVGGGTDVYLIDPNQMGRVMDIAHTREWEKELEIVELWTVSLFKFLSDPGITPEWIERRFKEFREKAELFCDKVRVMK